MASGEDYVLKAAEFRALAEAETNPKVRNEFEQLARAYLRLAGQAKRNVETDITYEPPPPKLDDSQTES
ncbi:MAG TPA: hypothetical protein VKD19_13200 [Pseudolabrys sp.]|nr:hypothetical protein [Pseudolabrys sp.]